MTFISSPSALPLPPLLSLSSVQSVVVGMPSVSQVTLMEEQQRQANLVRLTHIYTKTLTQNTFLKMH